MLKGMETERAYWVAWLQIPGIGPILVRRIRDYFGSLAIAWTAAGGDLLAVEGLGLQLVDTILRHRAAIAPDALLEEHERANPHFWTLADPDYPRLLLELPDPPPVLYYRGTVPAAILTGTAPTIAIVGTRSPSDYGRKWTTRITKLLVQHGYTIVSGLAEGIDTVAHRSCLEMQGPTIAVLGCGVDIIYPWSNRSLYRQILDTGLIISEYPAGTQPDRTYFPRRNRIIAGLSRATLVMEAPAKSGGLITAHYANDYGRDVYALPGSLDNPKALGCLNLIEAGANLILEQTLLDKLGLLPAMDTPSAPIATPPLDLAPNLAAILATLSDLATGTNEAIAFDRLVQSTQRPANEVSSALLELELMGLVTQLPGMRYQRV